MSTNSITEHKYLELILMEHLKWHREDNIIHKKANRALALRVCGGFHFNTYSMLFNHYV